MFLLPAEHPSPRELAYAVVDLETTGGSPKGRWNSQGRFIPPSEITEAGVVCMCGTIVQDRWDSLSAIHGPLPAGVQRLTGISLPMLATAPTWERVALALSGRLEGRIWVAHHAPFDGGFLRAWLPEGLWKRHTLICTIRLAKRLVPEAESRSLAGLCQSLGILNRRPHRALPDAEATADLLAILIQRAEAQKMSGEAFLKAGQVPWDRLK